MTPDLKKFFEVLPPDLGLLIESSMGNGYYGEAKVHVLSHSIIHVYKDIIRGVAKGDHDNAANLLKMIWPSYEEVDGAPVDFSPPITGHHPCRKTWSLLVQRVAGLCSTCPFYVSIELNLIGMDKILVKKMLLTIGDYAIGLVLRALSKLAFLREIPQNWKKVGSSGGRRRLCSFFMLKYKGLRVLVICDP